MKIEFFKKCVPPKATAQQKGCFYNKTLGRVMHFKKKNVAEAEHDYMTLLAPHAPKEPLAGPIRLEVTFIWPFRKSEPKRRAALGLVPMDTKPDFDNIAKALCDTMTKLCFWKDDAEIYCGTVKKFWGATTGIHILAYTASDDDVACEASFLLGYLSGLEERAATPLPPETL